MDLEKFGRVEINLTLPEADIDGLYFNEQKVHAIFDKQDDGWYHSRDILFLSARNLEDDNSRDILTEYLNDYSIKWQIAKMLNVPPKTITVALPLENKGIKKYHGVDCWYWLNDSYSWFTANFCVCNATGTSFANSASAVGGVAPAFRVGKEVTL